ncbi:MAG: hypothetical protein EB020_03755, partial [Proteobacteria bacterium]|nr:hypothetical protein [Pseudomonadota bacterium]
MHAPERSRLLWCTPGLREEYRLLEWARAEGWTIARQCVDAADVVAAASIESACVVVVSPEIQRMDPALWSDLCSRALRVIVLRNPGDAATMPAALPGADVGEGTVESLIEL